LAHNLIVKRGGDVVCTEGICWREEGGVAKACPVAELIRRLVVMMASGQAKLAAAEEAAGGMRRRGGWRGFSPALLSLSCLYLSHRYSLLLRRTLFLPRGGWIR